MSKPELFVEPDPELPLALLDQKEVCVIHVLYQYAVIAECYFGILAD